MLLAAPDQNVVSAALSALVAFVRKTHVTSIRWQGFPELNAKLLALAKGWGGREQVGRAPCLLHSTDGRLQGCMGCLAEQTASLQHTIAGNSLQ